MPGRHILAPLLPILSLGCGSLGEPLFPERRLADVAPWHDLGPLTICDGSVRLGAADVVPLGACVERDAVSCTRDADCASRERCSCGRCLVPLCTLGDECPGGWMCNFAERRCDRSCREDGDCAAGELCAPGEWVCRGRCASANDCQQGELCVEGRCSLRACDEDAACHGRGVCLLERLPARLREPAPLVEDDGVTLWLEQVTNAGSAIVRARSTDGMNFHLQPALPVIAPRGDDDGRAGAPTVLHLEEGGYVAVYANGRGQLRRASSHDGIEFFVDEEPLLSPTLAWQADRLDGPSLALAPQGGWLLYFANGTRDAIGLATSPDGGSFSPLPTPVLTTSDVSHVELWRDVDALTSPFAEAARDPDGHTFLRLFFAARGVESGPTIEFGKTIEPVPNFSLGAAATLDGTSLVAWPYNPVFDRIENFVVHASELEPAVITMGDRRLLYYRGAGIDELSRERPSVAESPVPLD